LLSLTIVSFSLAQLNTYEIFPLKKNLHYTYDYYSRSSTHEVTMLTELTIDSGVVEYIVYDSTIISDTTMLWNVEERRSIWHTDSISFYGRKDTAYWIRDTTFFSMSEGVKGLHQLTSKSFLWQFPIVFPLDTQCVTRFSNNPKDTVAKQWYIFDPCTSGNDTLLFIEKLGYSKRISSSLKGGCHNTRTIISTKFNLRGSPVSSIPELKFYPAEFALQQNFPNPFNPSTTIQYTLSTSSFIILQLYDLLGRKIKTLDEGLHTTGQHSILLQADDLTSGIYFYRLTVGTKTYTKKMLLVR